MCVAAGELNLTRENDRAELLAEDVPNVGILEVMFSAQMVRDDNVSDFVSTVYGYGIRSFRKGGKSKKSVERRDPSFDLLHTACELRQQTVEIDLLGSRL